jgi:zinc/manganese transport system substrate-binding protein
VVTTTVLGALVRDVVGERARVEVLMPNGVDPHDFQASARDAERLAGADLIVENGLDLEEGLHEALDRAEEAGVPRFTVTDHVPLRELGEAAGDEHGDKHGDEHGSEDPHVWLDPVRMAAMVAALAPAVERATGVDVSEGARMERARLLALDADLRDRARTLPPERRTLVTGHESMGYFADRYGFTLIGAIIPSLSSQAEPSARQIGELVDLVREEGVPAIFSEIGTPPSVAEAIADDAGVRVVELGSHTLPDDGSYVTFMRELMDGVVGGLRESG